MITRRIAANGEFGVADFEPVRFFRDFNGLGGVDGFIVKQNGTVNGDGFIGCVLGNRAAREGNAAVAVKFGSGTFAARQRHFVMRYRVAQAQINFNAV